jgi:hypothetical protein
LGNGGSSHLTFRGFKIRSIAGDALKTLRNFKRSSQKKKLKLIRVGEKHPIAL